MTKVLKLVFASNGKTMTCSLADPKDGLTKDEVLGVMNEMLEKEAVLVNGNAATAVEKAYVQETERIDII